jgi:hypothetical protein
MKKAHFLLAPFFSPYTNRLSFQRSIISYYITLIHFNYEKEI